MIFETQQQLKERIEALTPRRVRGDVRIHEVTTSYMEIEGGDVLRLGGNDYFILANAREGRFGIDDQPKFWVKYAIDLGSGAKKIIKLVFHEQFTTNVGLVRVRCTRNPHKETDVLDLMRGHESFMQGVTVLDPANNPVRVIDFVPGKTLYTVLEESTLPHEQYWHESLPGVMKELIVCIEAMAEMHARGQHHGDVRNDHIIIERNTGRYTWIDFDFEVNFSDYDVWSMGNVITFVVGQGMHTFRDVEKSPKHYPHARKLVDEDALVLYKHRLANLQKLFPYIPNDLNEILMRFSIATADPYEDLASQVRDLKSIFG